MKRLIAILSLILPIFLYAQRPVIYQNRLINNPQIRFKRINTDLGLCYNKVTDILQDIHGFMWIATLDGLNRYDGKEFEIFRHNEDNFMSINSSYVLCLEESPDGNLFIGTDKGLNKYNRQDNSFTRIILNDSNLTENSQHIRQMLITNDSLMWIETLDGFLVNYNFKSDLVIKTYKHQFTYQPYYLYHDIYEDTEGTLWIGTRNRAPTYLDKENDKLVVIHANRDDYDKKREYDVACFYEDSYGNFWITALDGIYLFDKKTEIFRKFLGTSTWDVHEDKNGNIWFATGNGLLMYNTTDSVIVSMTNHKDNPLSISNNGIYKICEDQSGNLWLATDEGINIYSPPAYPFQYYVHIPGTENSPEGYYVTSVEEDNDQNLWIGYEEDGLDYFNRKTETFTHYNTFKKKRNNIACNNVSTLYFSSPDSLWIGLWKGIGFNLLNTKTGKFTLFTFDNTSYSNDWYNDFVMDDYGNFYLGFWGAEGIMLFDEKKGEFLHNIKNKFERVYCSRLTTKMILDNNQTLWFGTTDCGLHKYYPAQDSGVSYFSDVDINRGLFSNEIKDLCCDKEGNIWIINNRLQKYIPEKDTFLTFGYSNGLTTKELTSIIDDEDGNLWIGSKAKGLYKFNPNSEKFTHYLKQDGLKCNSFTGARKRLSTGELFFGNIKGFNIFNPGDIIPDENVPNPYYGRLYVYDHIYSHDLNLDKEVILKPEEKVFTVELLCSDLANPERYSYQCMLEGYDENWVEIDNKQRQARYASVPPGIYNFRYRVGNRNGFWIENKNEIVFKINKPFYLTYWFISIIILLFFTILHIIIKQREAVIKRKQTNIELQQKLFRLQMNPHFIYNSLLAIQNYIFLNEPKQAGNYLSDFARLFRLILNNSRSEFITIEKEIETLNLYLKLQSLRYPDKFTYNIFVDDDIEPEIMMIPPMLAQPMIENALEHGLFYKKGKGNIEIRFLYKVSKLGFEVRDNGIGLSQAKKKNKVNTEHKSTALQITKKRIKILGSRYRFFADFRIHELKDKDGNVKGTRVMFDLPFKFNNNNPF